MPIYEYECEKCKERTEALQKADDPPLEKCEKCGGPLHKCVGGGTFHLYGPGFYTTDNKRKYLK
ncbi:FmdB family zinc ribbon protein [Nitrospina gracilis]|uniref:FmdB family zinc ribbon protein n=1 Tax=Nitrospina gracilis TaxID=35801 RepID=UPI001F338A18|nr:FmdB family zinc ribbon protein [Nitrospina gracilis]MCF8720339.1 putative FmdB family regulatory protein [Nitrospina gracilis Nb-211]